ncbi:hypothetical protein J3R30DRAFT_2592121 [Lentinula aciculospora]|uniref:DUF4604 domain-containing protein n=1 Tax=Lentinula aciculospora TaxID=153920 RepID=A0A9W9ADE1_9AGAR|nr:hypothetical protein J3R30DRAFT_2592121 [Lentinula aciculospora]
MSRRPKSPTRAQFSSRLAYEKRVPKFLQRLKNQVEGKTDNSSYDEEDEDYHENGYRDTGYRRDRDVGHYEYRRDDNDRDEFGRERRRVPDGEYNDDEFENITDGSGRPPIPRRPRSRSRSPQRDQRERPPIPNRPDDDPGSADEDSDDEKPQVVVLKAGKHLNEREAENERRKEKGLPPLPNLHNPASSSNSSDTMTNSNNKSQSAKDKELKSLSFSSKSSSSNETSSNFNALKRKVLAGAVHDDEDGNGSERRGRDGSKGKGSIDSHRGNAGTTKKRKKEKKALLSFGDDA